MAKKRTKADKLQRNVERLARRDEACRQKSANQRSEPLQAEAEIPSTKRKTTAA